MNFSNLKEWETPRGKVKELAINGKIAWKYHTHSYTAKVTAPTCTAQGYTTYTCSCGDSYVSDYKAAAGHKYGTAYLSSEFSTGYGQKCSVCGALKALSNPYMSALAVGSSVFMNVNGAKTEFIVVHQGLPSSVYDSSCNGTWLLAKKVYESRAYDSKNNDYENSDIHSHLNSTFVNLFDSDIKNVIKQVKIPYRKGSGSSTTVTSGSSGLSVKVFLLSYTEVGFSGSSYAPVEGAALSYFNGAADSKRATNNQWWLRSPSTSSSYNAWAVDPDGSDYYGSVQYTRCIRPAFILPSSTVIDGTLISKT